LEGVKYKYFIMEEELNMKRFFLKIVCVLLDHKWVNIYDMRKPHKTLVACRRCGLYDD